MSSEESEVNVPAFFWISANSTSRLEDVSLMLLPKLPPPMPQPFSLGVGLFRACSSASKQWWHIRSVASGSSAIAAPPSARTAALSGDDEALSSVASVSTGGSRGLSYLKGKANKKIKIQTQERQRALTHAA